MCILELYVNNKTRTEIPVSNCVYQYTLKETHTPCTLLWLECEMPSTASCPWTQTLADVQLCTSSKWVLPGDSDSTEWCVLGIIDQPSCLTILSLLSNSCQREQSQRKHIPHTCCQGGLCILNLEPNLIDNYTSFGFFCQTDKEIEGVHIIPLFGWYLNNGRSWWNPEMESEL